MKNNKHSTPYTLSQPLLIILNFAILTTPLLFVVWFSSDTIVATTTKKVFFILYGFSFLASPFAFLKPKVCFWLLIALLIPAIADIYTVLTLNSSVNEGLFAAILNTNKREALELLTSNKLLIAASLIALSTYLLILIKIKSSYRLPKSLKYSITAFILLIQSLIIGRDALIAFKSGDDYWATMTYLYQVKAGKVFPVNWILNASNYISSSKELEEYEQNISNFQFGAQETAPSEKNKLIVYVIGETARRHNFSLYGYHRETNPCLANDSNLIVMQNAETVFNITSKSYPVLLSRATPSMFELSTREPSILNAFREAGFKTYYINNQNLGYGSIYYKYAHQADSLIDLNPSLDKYCTDEPITEVFNQLINSKSGKTFIIIHTAGSHFRYNLRYPSRFEKFKPNIDSKLEIMGINAQNKDEMINSYDNSILFTDYFLSQLISSMKKDTATASFMLYTSDHGENLFDDDSNKFTHGGTTMTRYEREIPLLIWRSTLYDSIFEKKIQNITKHKHTPIYTTNFFHTLLDISGITIDQETLSNSFASDEFKPRDPKKQFQRLNYTQTS